MPSPDDIAAVNRAARASKVLSTSFYERHYYVSAGYNMEQAIVGFLPSGDGTLVVYTSHTSTDQVLGFGASVKRALGCKVMAAELERLFETTRAGLER